MSKVPKPTVSLSGIAILLLLLICAFLHFNGKAEFQNRLEDISRLKYGSYTVTVGVYGSLAPSFDIQEPNIQKQIVERLSCLEYDGHEWFPAPMTAEDHVYWLTFFSSDPFLQETWEIGGEDSRNCALAGNNHRLRLKNTQGLYELLRQIEIQTLT